MIRENLIDIEAKITAACARSGRKRSEVTLIAVSKTQPVSMIEAALETGIIDFGENKVQELVDKESELPDYIKWHMIGHLQRNKVKYIVDKVSLIHSVDSLALAREIDKESDKKNIVSNILIQVNIAGEATKYGIAMNEVCQLVTNIAALRNLKINGLMAIPPFVHDPEENRGYFRQLMKLFIDIKTKNIDNVNMSILSMGMSGDFEVAIEEGATMVRVGTSIFGKRDYS